MLKKTVVALLMALSFVAIAGQSFAEIPEPSCFPCPTASQK
jgi:hypothetical protein